MSGQSIGAVATPALSGLDFPALNRLLDHYADKSELNRAGAVEKWALGIGILGAALGMLLGNLVGGRTGVAFALSGLIVELGGLGLSGFLQFRREWPQLRHPRAHHAAELETGFLSYQSCVEQLRAFPLAMRQQRQRYIRDRRSTMHERLGLFTGGMDRLGVMPVLLALYLQFKDWRWGHWQALLEVTLVQGALAVLLLVSYALSWYLISLRMRVQAYELLLAEANHPDGATV